MTQSIHIHCAVRCEDSLGEGCLWDSDGQSLWWIDIARPSRLHRFTPATGAHRTWHSNLLLTTIALRRSGGLVVGGEDGVYYHDKNAGDFHLLAHPETDQPGNRFNDGACDPQGRLWIGTMQQNIGPRGEDLPITADTGALYRVDGKGNVQRMETAIGVSNGPCWSPDGRIFYFSDSRNQVIYAYDFDGATGRISNRRIFNDSKDYGYPDGATVDAEGFVWSARWDGSCVLRFDPNGTIDRVVSMPATRPTCVCFGGENLQTIYVTSSRTHVSPALLERYPNQGGVFSFEPGVKGLLKNQFSG